MAEPRMGGTDTGGLMGEVHKALRAIDVQDAWAAFMDAEAGIHNKADVTINALWDNIYRRGVGHGTGRGWVLCELARSLHLPLATVHRITFAVAANELRHEPRKPNHAVNDMQVYLAWSICFYEKAPEPLLRAWFNFFAWRYTERVKAYIDRLKASGVDMSKGTDAWAYVAMLESSIAKPLQSRS